MAAAEQQGCGEKLESMQAACKAQMDAVLGGLSRAVHQAAESAKSTALGPEMPQRAPAGADAGVRGWQGQGQGPEQAQEAQPPPVGADAQAVPERIQKGVWHRFSLRRPEPDAEESPAKEPHAEEPLAKAE